MRVRATQLGYYRHRRWREGAEFEIDSAKDFSPTWMEQLEEAPKPRKAKASSSPPVRKAESDEPDDYESDPSGEL